MSDELKQKHHFEVRLEPDDLFDLVWGQTSITIETDDFVARIHSPDVDDMGDENVKMLIERLLRWL